MDQTAADFTADTISLILTYAANNAPFDQRYCGFESLDWIGGPSTVIIGREEISNTRLSVSLATFTDHGLFFVTPLQTIGLDNSVRATFRVLTDTMASVPASAPATMPLLLLAFVGLGFRRRRSARLG